MQDISRLGGAVAPPQCCTKPPVSVGLDLNDEELEPAECTVVPSLADLARSARWRARARFIKLGIRVLQSYQIYDPVAKG